MGISIIKWIQQLLCERVLFHTLFLMTFIKVLQDFDFHCGSCETSAFDWHEQSFYLDVEEDKIVHPGDIQIFRGTDANLEEESFKEVLLGEDELVIGSKNAVYQLYMADEQLTVHRTIIWRPSEQEIGRCERLGKLKNQCFNYIRVICRTAQNELLICGTRAYSPECRTYRETEIGYILRSSETGVGSCPFDHRQSSVAVYSEGALYSGTVADLASKDALIYRKPTRTEQHDSQWLNEPDFIYSFSYGSKIYFIFRETAIEHLNCGKAIFSRVGRVCKNDNGGSLLLKNVWTSFFKSRLNCSIPGEFPFYFDEIQASSELGRGHYHSTLSIEEQQDMIYTIFTTPRNGMSGSAVCAFRMLDILKTFDGPFKAQKNIHAAWLPIKDTETPTPHPAQDCHNDSRVIPDNNLMFIKMHPLMDLAVPAFGNMPILIQSSFNYRMTKITVDWQYRAVDGRRYDILYIGTNDGRVIKAVNKNRSNKIETVVIEDLVVFHDGTDVQNLKIYRSKTGTPIEHLVVVAEKEVRILPLHRCHMKNSCSECVAFQDPYCSWDVLKGHCINLLGPDETDTRFFYQSIETGKHSHCIAEDTKAIKSDLFSSIPYGSAATTHTVSPCGVCTCKIDPRSKYPVTPVFKSDESHITMPQRDYSTSLISETPQILQEPDGSTLESISSPRSCHGGKLAVAIVIPSLVFGLLGFLAGIYYSRRKITKESSHSNNYEESHHRKTENTYSQDPANKYVTTPPFPAHGSVKIFHNPTKQCNIKVVNGSVEAIVEPHKDRKVYV